MHFFFFWLFHYVTEEAHNTTALSSQVQVGQEQATIPLLMSSLDHFLDKDGYHLAPLHLMLRLEQAQVSV